MRFLLSCLFICIIAHHALAQVGFDSGAIEKQLSEQKSAIDKTEITLNAPELSQEKILELRQSLRTNQDTLQNIVTTIQPALDNVKADITDLGPAPNGENAITEPESVLIQRTELQEKSLMTEGLMKQTEALSSKTSRLLEKVAAARRGQFINQLFNTQISLFDKTLWQNANHAFHTQMQNTPSFFGGEETESKTGLIASILVFLGLFVISVLSSRKSLIALNGSDIESPLSIVARSLVLPITASALGLFIVYQTFLTQGIITDANALCVQKGFFLFGFVLLVFIITARLSKASLIRPTMHWLCRFTAVIYASDALLLESGRLMGAPLELAIAQTYVVTTLFALILGALSIVTLKKPKIDARYFLPRQLFFALLVVSILLISANFFGYAAFGRFIFERVILTFCLLVAALLIRALVRPYFTRINQLFSHSEEQKPAEGEENLIYFWLSLTLDTVLFFLALPILASIFGAELNDIQEWAMQAFFGFKIGTITVSIANVGIAILLFLSLLFVTRLIQKVLSIKILPKTKVDASIQQSIIQVLGYIGLIVSLLAGVSAVGFDLTNLALIAGALSVGIGFGLQSIVSNFVSGLILLFERPIKVNDWIITNSGEGIVKKISVRATEIETFDKTSIIVPNSELISSSVKNWTHKDKIGRVIVTVGVSYDSDPHQVKNLLLECAENNTFSLKKPEPSVHFKEFGDSALIFDIRFFIRNVSDKILASTQMRYDIWDAFKDAKIEISFPQQDLHIRSAPGLEALFKEKKKK